MIWGADGSLTDLGVPAGSHYSQASAINRAGQVVGDVSSTVGSNDAQAAYWSGGSMSFAYGVNDAGWVVGKSYTAGDLADHATLWRDGRAVDLGALPGSDYSVANAANNHGLAVGTTLMPNFHYHALIWDTADDSMLDLNTLLDASQIDAGLELMTATAVSDSGWIVGYGDNVQTGELFAFAMQVASVPEPGTGGMALCGLVAGAMWRRRMAWRLVA